MATVEWQVRRETFNPEKNYFNVDCVEVSREISDEEDTFSRKASSCVNVGISLVLLGVLVGLIGCPTLAALELFVACVITLALCIASILVGSCYFMNRATYYEKKLDEYVKEHDVWNTPEVQAVEQYNKEQNEFAAKWRAEHPLEEKIRACLLDPKSSVDVANLARYYAVEYLKELKNDES